MKKYLTTKEVSSYLSLSASTLIAYRANEEGPPYKKIGRLVRYDIQEVEKWVNKSEKKSEKGLDTQDKFPNLTVISRT